MLTAGSQAFTFNAGGGNDSLYGSPGNDSFRGGDGDDRLFGSAGADQLLGEGGADQVNGGDGNDLVDGGAGDDGLERCSNCIGSNNDPGVGADAYFGGPGGDKLWLDGHAAGMTISIDGQANDGSPGEGDNIASDIEAIGGTVHNDVFAGSAGPDNFEGNGGDDDMHGAGGNDDLYGGSGDDRVFGDAGADKVQGASGADSVDGGPGHGSALRRHCLVLALLHVRLRHSARPRRRAGHCRLRRRGRYRPGRPARRGGLLRRGGPSGAPPAGLAKASFAGSKKIVKVSQEAASATASGQEPDSRARPSSRTWRRSPSPCRPAAG